MNYQYHKLSNGLRIVALPMLERNSAAVAIWVRAGARFEPENISGISHYLEHMVFKGTKTRSARQIKQEIEGVGGLLNAFTGEEATCYFAKLLHQHYPQALDVLADMVNDALIDVDELNKERTVILEEIKMYKDQPSQYVHEIMGELLWPDQPLGRPIAGSAETVTVMSRNSMKAYRDQYYHPKNILVTVSGPVLLRDVQPIVEKCFERVSLHPASQYEKSVSRQTKPRTLFLEKQTEQTHFVIGLHTFSRYDQNRYKLILLNVILGANMSSRLFEEVREKRGLAYEIRSGLSFFEDTGAMVISAGVETCKTPKAITVILQELSKMNKKGIHEDELKRAKEYFMSQFYMTLEDTLDHNLWVGERMMYSDKMPDAEEIRQGIEMVTTGQIRELAREIFKTSNINLSLIGPVGTKIQSSIKNDFEVDKM
ncbi:MAG: pitrilysin family protein [Candidatus Omnitrophica bacterium]|nr:pitrilysin family protein [Candidatus Omnitrophota bacterium]